MKRTDGNPLSFYNDFTYQLPGTSKNYTDETCSVRSACCKPLSVRGWHIRGAWYCRRYGTLGQLYEYQ